MQALIDFLSQGGPRHPKHTSQWLHPISSVLLHYLIITTSIIFVHDITISSEKQLDVQTKFSPFSSSSSSSSSPSPISTSKLQIRDQIIQFTFLYFLFLLSYRIILHFKENQNNQKTIVKGVLYECTWLCNSTLFMGAIGLWTKRDIMVLAHVVAVSIDQVLWYVDLTGWVVSGFRKFPIGVAKYLTWPETTWAKRITCTHHLWTIPLFMYGCNGITYPMETYLLSFFVIVINVCLSRWMTPFVLTIEKKKNDDCDTMSSSSTNSSSNNSNSNGKQEIVKYLNVNLSHELWKDIKIEALQIKHDDPTVWVYLFRLLWRWQVFNGIVLVLVLYPLSLLFYPYG